MFENFYIGLKDKNGRPLKEGDEISFEDYYKNKLKGVIKYNEKKAKFVVKLKNCFRTFDLDDIYNIELIKENTENIYTLAQIYHKDDFEYMIKMSLSNNDFKRLCKYLDEDDDLESELWSLISDKLNKIWWGDKDD